MTKCYECKYELSDCKGNKQDDCPNFSKKCAVNYPQRVRELEKELELNAELCEVFRKDNARLKDKYEKGKGCYSQLWGYYEALEKENAELKDKMAIAEEELDLALDKRDEYADKLKKAIDENVKLKAELKQADEAYDIQGKQLLEALDEIERLKDENFQLDTEWNKLKDENEKLKAELEKSVECGADCNACIERCRAWQNGYNHNRPTTEIIGTKALIESYIDRLQNCGLGKKKSLEYVGKFVSCLIVENGVIPNE